MDQSGLAVGSCRVTIAVQGINAPDVLSDGVAENVNPVIFVLASTFSAGCTLGEG